MTPEDNELTPETEDAPEHASNTKWVPLARAIGVVVALTAVIVCSYLLFNLFKDTLEPPENGEPVSQQEAAYNH